ncbi:MAG TPA: hypothetical protein VIN08_09920 [Ohtaekwangia sp.]|uniref:hypothetical protein n=1 Tax=Ohtaekwangia sp. TaxID=2066019 RepID=UPI002F94AF6C
MNHNKEAQFADWVKMGIHVLGSGAHKEDDEVLNDLTSLKIPEADANEILIFLPISFSRRLLFDINWPKEYVDVYSDSQILRLYSENDRYQIIEQQTILYFNSDKVDKDIVINIAGRSAELKAINDVLTNTTDKLSDVKVTTIYIFRD